MYYIPEIKKKYPTLYEIILERYKENKARNSSRSSRLDLGVDHAFVWSETPEGQKFWIFISKSDIKEAKRLYPEYFHFNLEYEKKRRCENIADIKL